MKNTDGDSADGERSGDVGRWFVIIGSNGLNSIGDNVSKAAAVADSSVAMTGGGTDDDDDAIVVVVVLLLVNSVELVAKCCIGIASSRGVSGITTLNTFRFAGLPTLEVVVVVVELSAVDVVEFDNKPVVVVVVLVESTTIVFLFAIVELLVDDDDCFFLSINAVSRFIVWVAVCNDVDASAAASVVGGVVVVANVAVLLLVAVDESFEDSSLCLRFVARFEVVDSSGVFVFDVAEVELLILRIRRVTGIGTVNSVSVWACVPTVIVVGRRDTSIAVDEVGNDVNIVVDVVVVVADDVDDFRLSTLNFSSFATVRGVNM